MFSCMTSGSSHTDSTKNTWDERGHVRRRSMKVNSCGVSSNSSDPTSHLESILLCKLDDGLSSLSGGVCGIKHLKHRTMDETVPQKRLNTVHCFQPADRTMNMWPTATWPPSSVRYSRTSFSAAEAHCLPRWEIMVVINVTRLAVKLPLIGRVRPGDVLTAWSLSPPRCPDGRTQRICRSSQNLSCTGRHWTLEKIERKTV